MKCLVILAVFFFVGALCTIEKKGRDRKRPSRAAFHDDPFRPVFPEEVQHQHHGGWPKPWPSQDKPWNSPPSGDWPHHDRPDWHHSHSHSHSHSNSNEGYKPPRPDYNPPRDGYQPPRPDYNPPRDGYQPPRPDYNPPRENYQPPRPDYNPPRPVYQPPQPNYNPPKPNYYEPPRQPEYPPPQHDNGYGNNQQPPNRGGY